MPTFMVTATELATAAATQPSAASIQSAWGHTPPPEAIYGHWEGSGPRISRTCLPGGLAVTTTVTQPYTLPDGLSPADLAIFQNWVATHTNEDLLAASPDFANVVVTPYNAALNGALALWQNGTAQNSASRDACIAGVLTEQDNPAGPVALPRTPTQVADVARSVATVAIAGVVVVGLVEFGPVLARALGAGAK